MVSIHDQKEVPVNSYQNWEEEYNNRTKRLIKCRCQGTEDCNDTEAHYFKPNTTLYEKIESLDRKKEIVSNQYQTYLRNQEMERINKLKQYQDSKLPQLAQMKQSHLNEQPLSVPSHSNLYNDFEKNMMSISSSNPNQCNSYYRNMPNPPLYSPPKGFNRGEGDAPISSNITDKSVYDKYNNKDYEDYIEKHKEYCDYNIQLSKNKKLSNERQFEIDKLNDGNVVIQKNFFNEYDQTLKSMENDKKQHYKQSLDEQRMYQVRSKLAKERYTVESAIRNPQYFYYNSPDYINQNFLNYNQYVEVNPCK